MKTKLLMKEFVTHDVMRFILEKPSGYKFVPGHATDISFAEGELKGDKHPFTFSGLPDDLVLEFIIKIYPGKNFTSCLSRSKIGTELEIEEPFGDLDYKGEGIFIAGGAGITPFISILRNLKQKEKINGNKLIFSNKEQRDIIMEKELRNMFEDHPENLVLTLTKQEKEGYAYGRVDGEFLKKHIKRFNGQNFYICGPPMFIFEIRKTLKKLGANINEIIFEGKK